MDDKESELRFDDEMGVHHTGTKIETQEVENHYDFEVEAEAVFKRLAEDIYQSTSAGIREPLTNSVTSVIRAEQDGYLDNKDDGIIVFELYDKNDSDTLIIRDNGVGLTEEEVDKVVTRIGKSTTRSETNLTGRFGMGFLATWMLTGGTDGGFIMRSNPRGIDSEKFTGIWTSNGFTKLDEEIGNSYGGLGQDQYGVELEITVESKINTNELITWIDDYSEWTRVPVLFRHHKEDGSVEDEEYPPKKVIDKYKKLENGDDLDEFVTSPDKIQYYKQEHDAFVAVNSNIRKQGRGFGGSHIKNWILMDVPMDHRAYNSRSPSYPFSSIEVRLNYETPMVVSGPHEGYFVEMGSEIPERLEETNDVISEEQLVDTDIVTPYPTGTRDTFKDPTGFRSWLKDKFAEQYYEDIATIVRDVDTIDDYMNLSEDECDQFHNTIGEISDAYTLKKSSVDRIESIAKTKFDPKFKELLVILQNGSIDYAPEGSNGVSRQSNREVRKTKEIIRDTYGTDKEVYMGHRITQDRAEFVWDSDTDHYVVRVESKQQDIYEDILGWKRLKHLEFETDLSMDDKLRRKYTTDTDVKHKNVTLHIGSYSNTVKIEAKTLKKKVINGEDIEDDDGEKYDLRKLIVFSRGGYNISDNNKLVGQYTATVSTTNDVFEYIMDNDHTDRIWSAEQALNYEVTVENSDGDTVYISGDSTDNYVYHVLDKESIVDFRKKSVMNSIEEYISDNTNIEDPYYIPLTYFEVEFADITLNWGVNVIDTRDYISNRLNSVPVESDVELYTKAVLDLNEPIQKALEKTNADWNKGGKELIQEVSGIE